MKTLLNMGLFLWALAGCAFAGQSVEWRTRHGSTDLGGVNGINNLSTFLVEFHIHDFTTPSGFDAYVFWSPAITCQLTQARSLMCGYYDKAGQQVGGSVTNLTGRNDVRVRIQLPTGRDQIAVETWDGNFLNYTVQFTSTLPTLSGRRFNFANNLTVGGVNGENKDFPGRMAFFKLRSTSTSLGAAAPSSGNAGLAGDIVSYAFENNLNDGSGHNKNLSSSNGPATYFATASYGVHAAVRMPNGEVGRVGSSLMIESISASDENITWLSWEAVSGPYGMSIANATSAVATMAFRTAGTYTVKLTVNVSNSAATTTQTFGVVAEDGIGQHTIPIDDPGMEFLLGPLLRQGQSEWPWYDATEKGVADALGPTIPSQPIGSTLGPGTISINTSNRSTITGNGTSFLSTFACNGTDWIVVHYPVVGGGTGLRLLLISSCASDTSMTTSEYFNEENVVMSGTVMSGASYGRATVGDVAFWANGSNNINYYDNVSAYYRLYYRTGNEVYRTYARRLADQYWRFPLDEGRSCTESVRGPCSPPRIQGLTGMMARALDGRPDMWPGIVSLVNDCFRTLEKDYDNASTFQDTRENGYCFLFMTQIAAVHPNTGTRATALSKAEQAAARFWRPKMRPDGSWRVTQYDTSWQGEGAQPWTHAYTLYGLASLYLLDGDPNVLADFLKGVNFLWDYGRDPDCRGMLYSVFYSRIAGGPADVCTFANGTTGYCHRSASCPGVGQRTEARTLVADVIAVFGLAYALTQNEMYREMGDTFFSAAYGLMGGPGADGGKNEFDSVLTGGPSFLGKQFGMNAGAGRASTYLALRLKSLPARAERDVLISFDLSAYSNASRVKMTLIYPSGYRRERVCTDSPCSIKIDERHGSSYALITEYLSSDGTILATNSDQPMPLAIQGSEAAVQGGWERWRRR